MEFSFELLLTEPPELSWHGLLVTGEIDDKMNKF